MNYLKKINTVVVAFALCLAPFALHAAPAAKVDVIVGYDAKPGQAEEKRIKALGGTTKREFKNFNMRVISVSENALKNVGNGKGV